MRSLRFSKPHLIIAATIFSAFVLLSSLPQTAPQRQHLYNLAFKPKEPEESESDGVWDDRKWGFQMDVPWFPLPQFRAQEIQAPAHNWQGPGHETYATFYATRDAHMSDPYFVAAQQVVYRVLWDPKSRSKHPMTVFVAPFVSEEQRAFFTAAGAIVREVELEEFTPLTNGSAGRLKDMFTKLEMWRQTDFSKILYLDSDAFPLKNVDEVFDFGPVQTCKKELLPPADLPHADDICEYVFAGYLDGGWGVNAGVMVLQPNEAMYDRLTRESHNRTQFDNGYMEQSLLNVAFTPDGPFPPSYFDHAYNGGVDSIDQGKPLHIVHHKLWSIGFEPPTAWFYNTFNDTWMEMLDFYKSEMFFEERRQDSVNAASITTTAGVE